MPAEGRVRMLQPSEIGQFLFFDLPLDPYPPEAGEPVVLHLSPDTIIWLDNPGRNV